MSVTTVWRIHRTARPNMPLNIGTYGREDWATAVGTFGAVLSPSTVAASRGYIEVRDIAAHTVTVSDG